AVQAIREIDAGMVHINWTPLWRADLMPYGGMKASGVGKEGFRTAVESMTEAKTAVLHGRPWCVRPSAPGRDRGLRDDDDSPTDHRTGPGPVPLAPALRGRRRAPPADPGVAGHLRPRQRGRAGAGPGPAHRGDALHPGPQRAEPGAP